jgi:hypothetical protein
MNELSIPAAAADDKPNDTPPAGYVRVMCPPGPSRAVKVGNVSYVSLEGRTIFVPPSHRLELLRSGWADAA